MAYRELMTWMESDQRWHKGYKGKRFAVSPRQLKKLGLLPQNAAETKDANRAAANRWWEDKQKEIDDALGKVKHPVRLLNAYEEAKTAFRLFARWQRRYGDQAKAEEAEKTVEALDEELKQPAPILPLPDELRSPIWEILKTQTPAQQLSTKIKWSDRFRQMKREEAAETATPQENTIRAYIDDYLKIRKAKAEASKKLGTYFYSTRPWLAAFRKFVSPTAPLADITEKLWKDYFLYLNEKVKDGEITEITMRNYQGIARRFVKRCWKDKYIADLPRNIDDRDLTLEVPLKEIVLFSANELKTILAEADKRARLYVLLALNCGFYPSDIGRLLRKEVKEGRIIRKRGKTRERSENVPRVNYKLWGETWELLQEYGAQDGEYALTNKHGGCLYVTSADKNKTSGPEQSWKELRKKLPPECRKPLKSLRKSAASLLETHAEFGRYAEFFLGEAPKSVATKHYIQPSTEQFDRALDWLGKKLGLNKPPKQPIKRQPRKKGTATAD
jgi:hypothetical protein